MRRTTTLLLALATAASSAAACGGGVVQAGAGDSGTIDSGPVDGTTLAPNDGAPTPAEGGPGPFDSGADSYPNDGGGDSLASAGGDASTVGGGVVDAGYYQGDGSFWVDGGAYPNLPDASEQGAPDAETDAAPGCGALAACCGTLSGSTQSLCDTIVGLDDASDCSTELAQLESAGDCTGVSILASQQQLPANLMASDGNLLFWTTAGSPSLLAVPVGGGAVTILLNDPITNPAYPQFTNPFLAVDDVNVYVLMNNSIVRIPKNGSAASLVNESGAAVQTATVLGSSVYWTEFDTSPPQWWISNLKSAPLQGTVVSQVATFVLMDNEWTNFAVTSEAVFAGTYYFPRSAIPAAGMTPVTSTGATATCEMLTSDTNAIYCNCDSSNSCSNLAIASNATATTLGPGISSSLIVADDTYAYWADMTTVGTIVKAPKAGGGEATVLARDTSPTAIAIDSNSIYWSDQDGYIKSVAK